MSGTENAHSTELLGMVRFFSRLGISRGFRGLYLAGELPETVAGKPVLFCPNHSNWWDGFIAAVIHPGLAGDREFGLLQEEEHLDRYAWFRRAGVLGIDLRSSRAALGGMRAALGYLARGDGGLWVFPQGVLLDAAEPVVCRPGASFLAKRAEAVVLPVGIRYSWMRESKPTIMVRIGDPLEKPEPAELSAAMTAVLEQIDADCRSENLSDYERVAGGSVSIHHYWDRLLELVRGKAGD